MSKLLLLLAVMMVGLINAEETVAPSALLNNLLSNYDKSTVPGALTGQTTEVKVGLYVMKVHIDEDDNEALVVLYFRQSWKDQRLQFNETVIGTKDRLYVTDDINRIWTPDTFISGETKPHKVDNRFLRIEQDGSVWYTQRMMTTVELRISPESPQSGVDIVLMVESFAHQCDKMSIQELDHPMDVDSSAGEMVKLIGSSTVKSTVNYTAGCYDNLEFTLRMQRFAGLTVKSIILPSILLVVLSWTAFWLNPKSISGANSRVIIGLVTVLAFFFFLDVGSRRNLSLTCDRRVFVTAEGLLIFVSLLFNVAAFVESVVAIVLSPNESADIEKVQTAEEANKWYKISGKNGKLDFFAKILFPVFFIIFEVIFLAIYFS